MTIITAKPSQSALLIAAQYEDCRCLPNEAVGHEALCWRSQHSLVFDGSRRSFTVSLQCVTTFFVFVLRGFCGALLHSYTCDTSIAAPFRYEFLGYNRTWLLHIINNLFEYSLILLRYLSRLNFPGEEKRVCVLRIAAAMDPSNLSAYS